MNRLSRVLAVVLFSAVSVVVLVGCFSGGAQLDGTHWKLVGWTVSSLDPAELDITAAFSDGEVSGKGGVNTYSGSYESGPGSAFEVGELMSTLMGGPKPAMRGESIYLALLREARSFEVANDRLTLHDEGGNESLIFEAVGE